MLLNLRIFVFALLFANSAAADVTYCDKLLSSELKDYLVSEVQEPLYVDFLVHEESDFTENPYRDFIYDGSIRRVQFKGKPYYAVGVQLLGTEKRALDQFLKSPGLAYIRIPKPHLRTLSKAAINVLTDYFHAKKEVSSATRIQNDFRFVNEEISNLFKAFEFTQPKQIKKLEDLSQNLLEFFKWKEKDVTDADLVYATPGYALTKKAYLQRLRADPEFFSEGVAQLLEIYDRKKEPNSNANDPSNMTPDQQRAYAQEFLDFCSQRKANRTQSEFDVFHRDRLSQLDLLPEDVQRVVDTLRFEHGVYVSISDQS